MRHLKVIGILTVVVAIVLGRSLWSELPKYQFEKVAMEVPKGMPGSRLLSSFKSSHLDSPISWFRPATTTWNFALPDRQLQGRFYTFTLVYGEQPIVFLVDADCEGHELTWYDLDEPESAFPARDLFGEPVVAPSGQTYRRSNVQSPAPPGWMRAFCETDWTAERKAAAQ
jgi:hypothetical protein